VLTLAVYWSVVPQRGKPYFLIGAGIVFYAWAVPAYLALIASLGVLTYVAARVLTQPHIAPGLRRLTFVLAVAGVVAVLLFFKYAKFITLTFDAVARAQLFPAPQIIVPLAISFFTFEFVHVLVDAYIGKIKRIEPLEFAVFSMFFPTLVAGPIKRYESFAPQVRALVPLPRGTAALHLYRIAIGLIKKLVLADSARTLAQPLVAPGAPYHALDYWVAWLAYTAQIYFDFTAYSDIAIGVAGLLGFAIPENFERPYWAPNISAFWRRWHISLSAWIRDYVFIPLGGSRRSPLIVSANLLVAMAIAGLWHGAAWTFVVWGLWHGGGLVLHRAWTTRIVPKVPALRRGGFFLGAVSTSTTFAFVSVGWLLFAATSFSNAGRVLHGLFRMG